MSDVATRIFECHAEVTFRDIPADAESAHGVDNVDADVDGAESDLLHFFYCLHLVLRPCSTHSPKMNTEAPPLQEILGSRKRRRSSGLTDSNAPFFSDTVRLFALVLPCNG